MVELVLNEDHLGAVLKPALQRCRYRLFIASADVKLVHVPGAGRRARSILALFDDLSERGVETRLLHSGIPSGPFLEALKERQVGEKGSDPFFDPETEKGPDPGRGRFTMRRCPRMHVKAVVADGRWMYLGSANLTGAGIGAKSARRRNFEAGLVTDDLALIDPVVDLLDAIWTGARCDDCGRRAHCPVPLEEPDLAPSGG